MLEQLVPISLHKRQLAASLRGIRFIVNAEAHNLVNDCVIKLGIK